MKNTQSMFQLSELEEETEKGFIKMIPHPKFKKLIKLNYTNKCVYDESWNPIHRFSRGSVVEIQDDRSTKIIGKAFDKFFNLNENEETMENNFDWNNEYQVYEKLDGILIIVFQYEDEIIFGTRGSFTNDETNEAVAIARKNQYYDKFKELDLTRYTLCFELISPKFPIIQDYQQIRDLFLIGISDVIQNTMLPPDQSRKLVGNKFKLPLAFDFKLEKIKLAQKEDLDQEGWVIYVRDKISGKYKFIKIKRFKYMELARFKEGISLKTYIKIVSGKEVSLHSRCNREETKQFMKQWKQDPDSVPHDIQVLIEGGRKSLESWINNAPEMFRGDLFDHLASFNQKANLLDREVINYLDRLKRDFGELSPKIIGLSNPPACIKSLCFSKFIHNDNVYRDKLLLQVIKQLKENWADQETG